MRLKLRVFTHRPVLRVAESPDLARQKGILENLIADLAVSKIREDEMRSDATILAGAQRAARRKLADVSHDDMSPALKDALPAGVLAETLEKIRAAAGAAPEVSGAPKARWMAMSADQRQAYVKSHAPQMAENVLNNAAMLVTIAANGYQQHAMQHRYADVDLDRGLSPEEGRRVAALGRKAFEEMRELQNREREETLKRFAQDTQRLAIVGHEAVLAAREIDARVSNIDKNLDESFPHAPVTARPERAGPEGSAGGQRRRGLSRGGRAPRRTGEEGDAPGSAWLWAGVGSVFLIGTAVAAGLLRRHLRTLGKGTEPK